MFGIFASLADFERSLIRERTVFGLEAAKARGWVGGRPKALTDDPIAFARELQDTKSFVQIAEHPGVGKATVPRAFKE